VELIIGWDFIEVYSPAFERFSAATEKSDLSGAALFLIQFFAV
jgi:hypothetical protein